MPQSYPTATQLSDSVAATTGFPLNAPLVPNFRIGSFFPIQVALTTADTICPIQLGRMPSGYIQVNTPNAGGAVYNGTKNGSDWTPSSITLAASIAGTYTILIF